MASTRPQPAHIFPARTRAISQGAAEWRDPDSRVRREARGALARTPWSAPVIEAALSDVLTNVYEPTVAAMVERYGARPGFRALVVLPGNVIGPALASAYCAAVAGVRVILKAAGDERELAAIVARQFDALGEPLAGTVDARYWAGGDRAVELPVFGEVERVVAFGEDVTVADIARRLPAGVEMKAYGSAYSVGYVAKTADRSLAAAAAARDICMFDQRGCMSPQTIYVAGAARHAQLFAHALADALAAMESVLPRAPAGAEEATAVAARLRRLSLTAVAPMTHGLDTLIVGPEKNGCPQFAVAVEPYGLPSCAGFGRIVSVKPCPDAASFTDALGTALEKLDTVGIAQSLDMAEIAGRLSRTRVCSLGDMQRPPFGYRPRVADFSDCSR
ncbi:MAG: hypothetical protein GIW99_08720 [Candidatus Eremiobacteraeota bacterium]|nr:hypothetical protein [Candidatus Eremiobacteraeota bacterium]MBC5827748.1 hypothetical protein [Candidatus Eremiobacteraeota bacterium]